MTAAVTAASATAAPLWAVPLALGRKEGFRLLRSPLPWIGVALSTVLVGLREGEALVLPDAVPWRGLTMFPMSGMVLVASTMATLRSRRHRTEELFASLSASTGQRTSGHLVATLFAGAVSLLIIGAWLGMALLNGAIGSVDVPDLLTGPVLVVSAGVTGVALARVLPLSWLAPPLVVAIGFIEGALVAITPVSNPLRRLAPWAPDQEVATFLTDRPSGWHLVYLAGIIGAVASIALLRTERGRGRGVKIALAVTLAVAVVAGFVQTRPMSDARAAEIADLIARPERHQTCEVRDAVRLCAYHDYAQQIDWWAPAATAVTARVDAHLGSRQVTVRQSVYGEDVRRLPRKVVRLLPTGVPRTDGAGWSDGAVHPSFSWPEGTGGDLYMALAVADWAVGLPPSRQLDGLCNAADQARSVVALWLAATATPGARATFLSSAEGSGDWWMFGEEGHTGAVTIEPPSWLATFPAIAQYGQWDLHIARQLVERPDAEVWSVLDREWSHFTNATTLTDELAGAFGIATFPRMPKPTGPACP